MSPSLINSFALILYVAAGIHMASLIKNQQGLNRSSLLIAILAATLVHALGVYSAINHINGVVLSIYNMLSLVALAICSLILASSVKKPLHNLFIFLVPFCILSIVLSLTASNNQEPTSITNHGVTTHILLSIVAYSLLAISALQAIAWSWQNNRLKQHNLKGTSRLLPPLLTMEALMFEILWAGTLLLGIAIIVGFLYLDDIFAQHLVHKTVLSLFSWSIFAALLWGKHALGWRGNTAVKWLLGGFCLLMLAYFGSKVVLEIILK